MNEFERRVGEALASVADEAPGPAGLADGARRRAGARRRTAAAVGAAVAVLALVVPVGVLGLTGERADREVAEPSMTETEDGWRTVSEGGVTIEVPADWQDGELSDWCPDGSSEPEAPLVLRERRSGLVLGSAGCADPTDGYGVIFRSGTMRGMSFLSPTQFGPGGGYPDDAWHATATVRGQWLSVVSPSRAVAQRIVDSAYGGCSPRSALDSRAGEVPELATVGSVDRATLCTYRVTPRGGRLVATTRLDETRASTLLAALRAAPTDPAPLITCAKAYDVQAVRIRLGDVEVWVNDGPDCSPVGVNDGTEVREITDDVRVALDPDGWRTVEREGIEVDVPNEWVRLDTSGCPQTGESHYGPSSTPSCGAAPLAVFTDSDFDTLEGPGEVDDTAYVLAGNQVVYLTGVTEDVARRILGSARVTGKSIPDLAAGWRTERIGPFLVDVPVDSRGIGVRLTRGVLDSSVTSAPATRRRDGTWQGWVSPDTSRVVSVSASTRALADLVASTVR